MADRLVLLWQATLVGERSLMCDRVEAASQFQIDWGHVAGQDPSDDCRGRSESFEEGFHDK